MANGPGENGCRNCLPYTKPELPDCSANSEVLFWGNCSNPPLVRNDDDFSWYSFAIELRHSVNQYTIALTAAIAGGALGQLFMKHAMKTLGCVNSECSLQYLMQQHSAILYLATGISLYVISIFLWIIALRKYPLNYAYPMLAAGYVIVYLCAALPPLSEALTTQKTLGVLLILIGVTLSSQQRSHKLSSSKK